MATGAETLDSWLNQATDPENQGDRWDCIQGFYQLVNQETDGPQVATSLLAHKIQSPQERESLQALTVLEACMNNCGKRFHSEAAKFRFLNELIKLLTPKYFGAWTPLTVKERVTEVLYGWTLWLKDEPKIQEAYNMLKTQGFVKEDPKLPDTLIMAPPPQRSTESVFDQEDKAKVLARLLKSTRPEDLELANRLIKSTIKEEQEKAEKALKRESTLQEVESSTRRLRELLKENLTGTSLPPGDDIKALYEHCDRLRPGLFRLASDTTDDDGALAQILAANDDLTLAVNAYKDQVGRRECNGARERRGEEEMRSESRAPTIPREIKSYHLIDLSALDSPQTHREADSPPFFDSSPPLVSSRLDNAFSESEFDKKKTSKSYYEELMQLNDDFQKRSSEQNGGRGVLLRARGCGSNGTSTWSFPQNHQFSDSGSNHTTPAEVCVETVCPPLLLKHVFVPMDTIKSSQLEPITLFDQGGVHVSLHFARNSPAGHPGVAVVVISTVNTSALQVRDLLFQAAVPKSMLVKLQPASGTQLAPYNPLLPPPATSQVVLLANPQKRQVRLRYKLTLTHGDQQLMETGDVHSFPDWNSLIGH
ncbi:ADP-ribosylation factor-binding protein GGA1-like [Limanda limanda]|uniref:ADP-ribosylation factor-binding protein GGA1-like n=1 Tax=Limanda limanda TaxID=27771 RepID=UPI0029C86D60|nr:ADP-ribosylation factor-binding protein GGA1-like [Limanda limanda]